jgi:hypothetical protein
MTHTSSPSALVISEIGSCFLPRPAYLKFSTIAGMTGMPQHPAFSSEMQFLQTFLPELAWNQDCPDLSLLCWLG